MFRELGADINSIIKKEAEVHNEAEDMEMTISLSSKHARNIRKIRKLGV